jgi:large subunit ribosomal protein L25
MATILKLSANRRKELGTTACRRLRRSGLVPGNIYGHGQEPLAISFDGELVRPVVNSGAHVVNLELDGESQTALIRDVQWDTFSTYVKHLDLVRVDANERVRLSVPVQLKGTALGALTGGIVEQPLHALHIECLAIQVPDFIPVKIGHLDIGQSVHIRELTDVPEGVTILDSPEALVVQIVKPGVAEESAEGVPGPAEPELIKREKKTEDEEA